MIKLKPMKGLYKKGSGVRKADFLKSRSPKRRVGEMAISNDIVEIPFIPTIKIKATYLAGCRLTKGDEVLEFTEKTKTAEFLSISATLLSYNKKNGKKIRGYLIEDIVIDVYDIYKEQNERVKYKRVSPSLIAVNIRTKERLYFKSIKAAVDAGFGMQSIYSVLDYNKKDNVQHKGYVWMFDE
jgi:hypothetical protein